MSDETGETYSVDGRSNAMAPSGPIPGSTPISVPMNTPTKHTRRFTGCTATQNPLARLAMVSI